MNHGSLFSGIGGFDLAAEWMGWDNIFHCEWNDFGKKVLKYYWPKSISYHDITKTDFTIHRGTIDILTGGFPCQPYSTAGKRLGKEDERHLWPEMLRAIREIEPTWIVGENVRGLVSWSGGLVFEEVCADLEAQGYSVQPFLLPAAGVNAPHRRDRIWFVARKSSDTTSIGLHKDSSGERLQPEALGTQFGMGEGFVANTMHSRNAQQGESSTGQRKTGYTKEQKGWGQHTEQSNELYGFQQSTTDSNNARTNKQMRIDGEWSEKNKRWEGQSQSKLGQSGNAINPNNERKCNGFRQVQAENGEVSEWNYNAELSDSDTSKFRTNWKNFPTVAPICNGDDGLSNRLDSITFSKWRNESIKAGGNAIVPQVAYQIFKAIQNYENQTKLF